MVGVRRVEDMLIDDEDDEVEAVQAGAGAASRAGAATTTTTHSTRVAARRAPYVMHGNETAPLNVLVVDSRSR